MSKNPGQRAGLWATGGAVATAIASSACCWLPLVLLGFGASAVGVATFFEAYRPLFLGAAALLLGGGFYFNYFRKERCAPGSSCETPNPKLRSFNRAMLWIAAVVVVAFAFFPNYVGLLIGTPQPSAAQATASEPLILRFAVEGMTCGGCAANAEKALYGVPGVLKASASYEDKSAVVELDPTAPPATASLIAAIEQVGYRASLTTGQDSDRGS